MSTKATLGIGTILEYETVPGASPIAYTKVDEVLDVPPLANTREFVEATNQDSTSYTKEYIAGLIDAEQFSVDANYIAGNASQQAVLTMFQAGTKRKWRVRPSGSPAEVFTFDAIVAAWTPSFPVQGKKLLSFTLRRTGPTVRT